MKTTVFLTLSALSVVLTTIMLLHQLLHKKTPIIYAADGEQMCKLVGIDVCGAHLKCEDQTDRYCVYHVIAKSAEEGE